MYITNFNFDATSPLVAPDPKIYPKADPGTNYCQPYKEKDTGLREAPE